MILKVHLLTALPPFSWDLISGGYLLPSDPCNSRSETWMPQSQFIRRQVSYPPTFRTWQSQSKDTNVHRSRDPIRVVSNTLPYLLIYLMIDKVRYSLVRTSEIHPVRDIKPPHPPLPFSSIGEFSISMGLFRCVATYHHLPSVTPGAKTRGSCYDILYEKCFRQPTNSNYEIYLAFWDTG